MKATATKAPEETRHRILAAAFEEFYRNGFQGGSLNHIIEEAGTTKGALFHHFDGKNELGYAVVDEVIQPQIKADWLDPLSDSIDPVTDIKQVLEQYAKDGQENGTLIQGCPLSNLAQEMSPLDEGFRTRTDRIYTAWREAIAAALARGIKAGTVRKSISPRSVGTFLVAALTGVIALAKNSRSDEVVKTAGDALFDYLDSLKP